MGSIINGEGMGQVFVSIFLFSTESLEPKGTANEHLTQNCKKIDKRDKTTGKE